MTAARRVVVEREAAFYAAMARDFPRSPRKGLYSRRVAQAARILRRMGRRDAEMTVGLR